jgi:hypothetical protein
LDPEAPRVLSAQYPLSDLSPRSHLWAQPLLSVLWRLWVLSAPSDLSLRGDLWVLWVLYSQPIPEFPSRPLDPWVP